MDSSALASGTTANRDLYRYRFGSVEFDEARFELRVGGLVVDLERKPLLVLLELLRRADEVVKRDELRDAVWEGRPGVEHGLSNCILKLRRALGPVESERIATVSKGGYRFVGAVERVIVGRKASSQLNLAVGAPVPGREEYLLERQLGETHRNEVWLAHRVVDDVVSVFKFSRHADSLANLKHETAVHRLLTESLGARADFVSLRSWNFAAPPYYIESDYCGANLAQWSADQDRLRTLSRDERLAIFLRLADAVAAAHSVGVLHKDLKPSNIFMIAAGATLELKVGDFGNASLLEPDRLAELGITQYGLNEPANDGAFTTAGTPFYLAPELIAGFPATIQSDVYALGLLLFQLVVGDLRRPMASDWQREISDPLLCEDIKLATAGDPSQRLASVPALTARLRDLAGRGAARLDADRRQRDAEALAKALEKTAARRPWIVALIGALLLGFAVALVLYHNERQARRVAEVEQRRSEATNRFLSDMLQRADPNSPGGESNTTIQSAIAYASQALMRDFPDDPAVKGSIGLTLGNTLFGLSQYEKAFAFQRDAMDSLSAALGPQHPSTLEASYHVAGTLDMLSRHREAEELLDRTDAAAGSQLDVPSRLSFLAHSVRGGHFLLQMQAAPAVKEFLLTEDIRRSIDPDNDTWLIHVRSDIAWCEVRLGRDADALRALSDLMKPAYAPQRIGMLEWMKLHLQYGIALANVGRFPESESMLLDAERQAELTLGPTHYLVGLAWYYLAASYKAAGRWTPAAKAAQREYQIFLSTLNESHQSTFGSLIDVKIIDYLTASNDKTLAELRDLHERLDRALGAHSSFTQYETFFYVSALLDHGQTNDAAQLTTGLDAQAIASADPSPYWQARLQGLRGRLLLAQERPNDASPLLKTAKSALTAQGAPQWMIEPLDSALRQVPP
jgi:DNA-binding winged helix-turn-helix (wHTH) protein